MRHQNAWLHRTAQGCAWLRRAAHGCTGVHTAAQGCAGLHRSVQGLRRAAQESFAELQRAAASKASFRRAFCSLLDRWPIPE